LLPLMLACRELSIDDSELISEGRAEEAEERLTPDSDALEASGDELTPDTPDDALPVGRAAALLLPLMLACRELRIDDSELISDGNAEEAEERLTPDCDALEASRDELTCDAPDETLPVG
jgi:hypothetical protein